MLLKHKANRQRWSHSSQLQSYFVMVNVHEGSRLIMCINVLMFNNSSYSSFKFTVNYAVYMMFIMLTHNYADIF